MQLFLKAEKLKLLSGCLKKVFYYNICCWTDCVSFNHTRGVIAQASFLYLHF